MGDRGLGSRRVHAREYAGGARSAGLEEEDRDLAQVEVDEVLGLVGDVGAEVPADDAVPGRVVLLVELLLDEGGDILLDVELLESLRGDVDGVLLHVLGHISVLDNSLAISHVEFEFIIISH